MFGLAIFFLDLEIRQPKKNIKKIHIFLAHLNFFSQLIKYTQK